MHNVLVTGGAGFIGSHLVNLLLQEGKAVTVFDNFSTGNPSNLPKDEKLQVINGDVRKLEDVQNAVRDQELIFHLAEYIPNTKDAGPGHVIKFSFSKPIEEFEVSARGTLNVLEAARLQNCKVVMASTAAVYGPYDRKICEDFMTKPISPYGASKLCAEVYCETYNEAYGLPVAIGRIFNAYGPKQKKYIMYDVLQRLKLNPTELSILSNPNNTRDFIFVEDVAKAFNFLSQMALGQKVNIGTGVATTVAEVVNLMSKTLNLEPKINYSAESAWKGDIQHLVSDNSKLISLGFKPSVPLKEGVTKFIQWGQTN